MLSVCCFLFSKFVNETFTGDAISPALIGFMADGLTEAQGFSADNEPFLLGYKALQYSMLMCPLMSLFGGAMFLWTGLSMVKDREDVSVFFYIQ